MDCKFVNDNLFSITENRLSEAEQALVIKHIAGCPGCTAAVDSFTSIIGMIEKDTKIEPDPFLAARILQNMESQYSPARQGIFFLIPRVLQPVLAVALILLAVFSGFLAGKQGRQISGNTDYKKDLSVVKSELFISELNDEDKTVELYK
ncbi:MAG: zf-HC2 domain-containing protein [Bacteroidetes bacterium]|nr:zf-HC2 domain-containing protein [Bacteroidota bacterium]